MIRIACPCCSRSVSPSRWDDDSGLCHYCLRAGCTNACRRGRPPCGALLAGGPCIAPLDHVGDHEAGVEEA